MRHTLRPLLVAVHRETVGADLGPLAGHDVGDQLARAAGHGPAQGAVAGVEEQVRVARGADDRGAVGRHRAQAGPEARARQVAAREQVAHHLLERGAALRVQAQVEARELGHAAHADAVVEARDGHLVGLVEHGRLRRQRFVDQRHRERIALDRVDGNVEAQRGDGRARVAAEGHHVAVGREHLAGRGAHAADAAALGLERLDALAEAEVHAQAARDLGQAAREQVAVAGLVVRQPQAAREAVARAGQRGFDACQRIAVEQFVGHAAFLEHRDVALHRVELRLRAEQLQGAAGAVLVLQASLGAQRLQAAAAVLGHPHHAFLVDRIALGRAVAQHLRHPAQLEQRAVGADRQRRMLLEHPLDRLQRNAGRGPGRGVAGRHLARVAEAGFLGRTGLPVEQGDVGARAREVVGRGGADHAAAQNDDFHGVSADSNGMMRIYASE